jgi:ABC-type transport system substrate-binding protein
MILDGEYPLTRENSLLILRTIKSNALSINSIAYNLERQFTRKGDASTYYNPEIEKISALATAEVNDAKRAELIKKAVKILREDVPAVPIFNNVHVLAMKKNIEFSPTLKHNMDLVLIMDITVR